MWSIICQRKIFSNILITNKPEHADYVDDSLVICDEILKEINIDDVQDEIKAYLRKQIHSNNTAA